MDENNLLFKTILISRKKVLEKQLQYLETISLGPGHLDVKIELVKIELNEITYQLKVLM